MPDALRPMTVGELLDRTFFLYRKHFVLFVGLVGLPHLFLLAVQLLSIVIRSGEPFNFDFLSLVTVLLQIVVYLPIVAVSQAATVIAVSRIHLGRETTISDAFNSIKGRIFTVALIMIVVGMGAGMGLVLCIVPGVLLALMWSLSIPVAVVEQLGVIESMSRSFALSKGSWGRLFVIYFLFFVLTYIFLLLIQVPIMVGAGLFSGRNPGSLPVWAQVAAQVGQFLTQCVVAPLLTIALSLVYYDQRVRNEAFDLEHMMSQLDGQTPA